MTVYFPFCRDRKRKNYVGEDGNVKKLRTESGVRIPATYKKNMYPVDIIRHKSCNSSFHMYYIDKSPALLLLLWSRNGNGKWIVV